MNTKLRTILFLVSITAIFAAVLLSEQGRTAKAQVTYTLTVSTSPSGSGTVSRQPTGIPGAGAGQFVYDENTVVTLTASPTAGWQFVNWTGPVSNASIPSPTVTMDADKSVTANFVESCYLLTLSFSGAGGSIPTASPIKSTGCVDNHTYHLNEVVTLTAASPTVGWEFVNWTGPVSNSNVSPTTITMNGAKSVTANYATITCYLLTLGFTGAGGGTPTASPTKSTGCVDDHTYRLNEVVGLSAPIPDPGWEFFNWTGPVSNANDTPTSITISNNVSVTANYVKSCYLLTLNHTGQGTNPTPSPTNSTGCPTNNYVAGESITLTPHPLLHYQVGSWSGTANPSSNIVNMPPNPHTAGVTYIPICYTLTVNWNPARGDVQYTAADCPGDVSGVKYLEGAVVGLEAFDNDGYEFANWTGADTGNINPSTVTMNGDRTVTANFNLSCHTLTRTHSPPGMGSNPAATPSKSASCANTGEYVLGQVINLTATPIDGWRVDSWSNTDNDTSTSLNNTLTFPALATGLGHVVGVTYIQKPTLQFKQASYQVLETGAIATIEVTRTGSTTESVDVWYATSDGTAKLGQDYKNANGRLTFDPGVVSQSFDVEIIDDQTKEGTETVNLTLSSVSSNAVLGLQDTAQLVILDDEGDLTVQFQTTTYTAQEISPTVPVIITMFPISTQNIYVDFQTQAGTATAGLDYTEIPPNTLRFKPGVTELQVDIAIKDDLLNEPNETIQLSLFNEDGAILGDSQATLTIIDDDGPPSLQFSKNQYFANEGDLTIPVSVTLSATSGLSATVNYEVIELSVGRQFAGTLEFNPGEVSKVIDIPVSEYQAGDTLNVILSDAVNATLGSPSSASIIILDKDRSECHKLTMEKTGYGKPPVTTNLLHSVACSSGEFVADELIFVLAEPDPNWAVSGWSGTLDNNLKSEENIVRMPDSDHSVFVSYRTSAFSPAVALKYVDFYPGTQESEPNDNLSDSNGPIQSGQDYFGGFSSTSDVFDNYFFYLTSNGNVQIQLKDIPIGRDYNLLLLDSNKKLRGYSGSLSNVDEHISVNNLGQGLYYVSVYFDEGPVSTAKYRLNVIYD